MKTLVLAVAVFIAGCAGPNSSATQTDPRLMKFQNESEEISARERGEYENESQQSRDRAALMPILTTSLPR